MTREQRLPSESGERFLGENDYRETIDRLEALLLEATEELEKDAWSVMDKDRVYRFRAALAKPIAHTDHPPRHFDRTCPACLVEQPDDWQRGMEQAAKICDERAAKHGTDDEAENEPLLCAALIRVWI